MRCPRGVHVAASLLRPLPSALISLLKLTEDVSSSPRWTEREHEPKQSTDANPWCRELGHPSRSWSIVDPQQHLLWRHRRFWRTRLWSRLWWTRWSRRGNHGELCWNISVKGVPVQSKY
ncbi:hypothetical protein C8R45DRAFT_1224600 [Mycena sanguinolenta]|nr:hypothetical protein C8R45DRAFT_1224600 [Mycena sanguinolenta]